jgi:hypothetical protein
VIPQFDAEGNLPPGIHVVTWAELKMAFGTNQRRVQLLAGLRRAAEALKAAGCSTLYVDGSFVTKKDQPGDFDGCWDPRGVDARRLDPVLLDFGNGRFAQKVKYGGELFPSSSIAEAAPPRRVFLQFFQCDKRTGNPKGIVAIDLTLLT